ncbi:hypothetical protein DL96DRAFT_1558779 [Flagelloscypha sp. PMI_526]|nr:hypothetical protein DL96DRAFT_1558779 [Flagelloscypha sp. PMI_526]
MAEPFPITECKIPSNSDIAGLGVRIAAYMSALITLLIATLMFLGLSVHNISPHICGTAISINLRIIAPTLRRLADSTLLSTLPGPSTKFLISLKPSLVGLRNGLFAASVAVIVSTLQAAAKGSLSVYHGLVVTNVTFLNTFSVYVITLALTVVRVVHGRLEGGTDLSPLRWKDIWLALAKEIRHAYFLLHCLFVGASLAWFWIIQGQSDDSCLQAVQTGFLFFRSTLASVSLQRFLVAYSLIIAIPPLNVIAFTIQLAVTELIVEMNAPLVDDSEEGEWSYGKYWH